MSEQGKVTDFITGRRIDIGELLFMADAAERNEDRVLMKSWFHDIGDDDATLKDYVHNCRTRGCLVGTYCCAKQDEWSELFWQDPRIEFVAERFGLSLKDAKFLFDDDCAVRLSAREAIERLRKFIYDKLHESELLADYDESRRIEGDQMYLEQAAAQRTKAEV